MHQQTILNLLAAIEIATASDRMLEGRGEDVQEDSVLQTAADIVFDAVLDAIGVPRSGHQRTIIGERPRFKRTVRFSRRWFVCRFFSDYLIEKEERGLSLAKVLGEFRSEVESNLEAHFH